MRSRSCRHPAGPGRFDDRLGRRAGLRRRWSRCVPTCGAASLSTFATGAASPARLRPGARCAIRCATLRQTRYDVVLDLQEQVKGALIARLARGRRHGFDRASIREPLATLGDDVHHRVPRDLHFVTRCRLLAGAALGYPVEGRPAGICAHRWMRRPIAARPYVVILHSTSRAEKLWPEARLARARPALRARGLCERRCRGEARRKRRAASGSPRATTARRCRRGSTCRRRRRCCPGLHLVVGVDTGLTHLAAALGTPTVALFTATDRAAPRCRLRRRTRARPGRRGIPAVARRRDCRRGPAPAHGARLTMERVARWATRCCGGLRFPGWPLRRRAACTPRTRIPRADRRALRALRGIAAGRRTRRPYLDPRSIGRRDARGRAARHAPAARRPAPSILLTHMTATGRATGHALFGDAVAQAWLPYDLPLAVRAFLRHFRPDAGLLVETELWPNLAAAAKNAGHSPLPRQCAPVRALGTRLRAHRDTVTPAAGLARRRRRAGRRRCAAARRARRARRGGDRQPQIRPRHPRCDARTGPRTARG